MVLQLFLYLFYYLPYGVIAFLLMAMCLYMFWDGLMCKLHQLNGEIDIVWKTCTCLSVYWLVYVRWIDFTLTVYVPTLTYVLLTVQNTTCLKVMLVCPSRPGLPMLAFRAIKQGIHWDQPMGIDRDMYMGMWEIWGYMWGRDSSKCTELVCCFQNRPPCTSLAISDQHSCAVARLLLWCGLPTVLNTASYPKPKGRIDYHSAGSYQTRSSQINSDHPG